MPPDDTHAENLLQREVGIAPELTTECLGILRANGLYTGILEGDVVTLPSPSGPDADPVEQPRPEPTAVTRAKESRSSLSRTCSISSMFRTA